MRKLFFAWVSIIGAIVTVGCSHSQSTTTVKSAIISNDTVVIVDTGILADKNYLYKNVQNTLLVWNKMLDVPKHVFVDSTRKTTFIKLTNKQKTKLVTPFMKNELGVNDLYVRKFMDAYFVAKQQKLGELQPIILYITGDDYGSYTLILLDKNQNFINGINVNGGQEPGPEDIGDSLINMMCAVIHC
jgi:hypothetical protein